jgi:hypothetical protein
MGLIHDLSPSFSLALGELRHYLIDLATGKCHLYSFVDLVNGRAVFRYIGHDAIVRVQYLMVRRFHGVVCLVLRSRNRALWDTLSDLLEYGFLVGSADLSRYIQI